MSTAIRDIAHRATGVNTGFSHVSVGFAENDPVCLRRSNNRAIFCSDVPVGASLVGAPDAVRNGQAQGLPLRYNARNQLTHIQDLQDAANDVQYSYDANGNQVQKVKGDKTQTFIFDVRNQMRAVYAQP